MRLALVYLSKRPGKIGVKCGNLWGYRRFSMRQMHPRGLIQSLGVGLPLMGVVLSLIQPSFSLFGEGKPLLVDIQTINPNICIDLKYATADNFTGQVIYGFNQCFVLESVAKALNEVQQELESLGLGLKVWDGYRPLAAQWKFWEICPDPRYVADPREGGRHTRGTAVDATLVDAKGQELVMPTGFDDFSEKAHCHYKGASEEATRNRDLLRSVMEKHGFDTPPPEWATEWWHFDFKGWRDQPVCV